MNAPRTVARPVHLFRRFATGVCTLLLPSRERRLLVGTSGLDAYLADGYGVLLLINHFSRRDPAQALSLLFSHPLLAHRPVLAPVSYHQFNPLVDGLGRLLGLRAMPVANPGTRAWLGDAVRRGAGLKPYLRAAAETLDQGGVVLLAPQGGRQPTLGAPLRGRPVRLVLQSAQAQGVSRVVVLIVAFALPGAVDYALERVGGANLLRPFTARCAPPLTAQCALDRAGGLAHVDDWVFAQLADLVPPAYLHPPDRVG